MGRGEQLIETAEGVRRSGVNLVSWRNDQFGPAGFSDDLGLHYFVPKLAGWVNLSIDQALALFISLCQIFTLGISGFSFLALFKSWTARLGAILITIFLINKFNSYEAVYIVPFWAVFCLIPLFLAIYNRNKTYWLAVTLFLCGIGISYSNYLRSQAGNTVLIFILAVILFGKGLKWKHRFAQILILILGFLVPILHFNSMIETRDNFLTSHITSYTKANPSHPLWHTAYLGLGYIENPYGISWLDDIAYQKVKQLNPGATYLSPEYEKTLRDEVFRIIKLDPGFFLRVVWVKLALILRLFLNFANVGILFAIIYRKPWQIDLAFGLALCFSSIYAIVAIPLDIYLVGTVALSVLFGIVSIGIPLSDGRFLTHLKKLFAFCYGKCSNNKEI